MKTSRTLLSLYCFRKTLCFHRPHHSLTRRNLSMLSRMLPFTDKIPYGFGNFYPKKGKKSSSSSDSKKKKEPKTAENEEKSSSSSKDKSDSDDFSAFFKKFTENSKQSASGSKPPSLDHKKILGWGVVGLVSLYLLFENESSPANDISYQTFVHDYLAPGRVKEIQVINEKNAFVTLQDTSESFTEPEHRQPLVTFNIGNIDTFERKLDFTQRDLGIDPNDFVSVKYRHKISIFQTISSLVTFAFSAAMLYWLYRLTSGKGGVGGGKGGIGGIFSIGKANPTVINKGEKVKTSFKDVAGLGNAKLEIMEFIDFLKDKDKFTKLGAKIPKGALLIGPPGTGKTLLAKAIAGESQCPFFSMSGSDFIEMFVGVGPSRVRDLFAQARSNAPCIVFIDEIDAVGRARGKGGFSGGNDERESTLNQLLVEMDGFSSSSGIVVLGGTNRVDILDKALLRPGRFDRQIVIDLPDIGERQEIFMVHLKPLTLSFPADEIATRMSALSPGFSGADIANVCNEAAILAARRSKSSVGLKDFEDAQDRIIGGLQKSRKPLSSEEKKLIAYHEAGHAVTGWFMKYADPLLKVTVIPRSGGVLGFAQYLPRELHLSTIDQLVDRMCMTLGGRVSELIFFNHLSTGAADDLGKVTELAYSQVKVFGFSEKIGHVSFPPKQEDQFGAPRPYSDYLAKVMDEEARQLIQNAFERTLKLLKQKKNEIILVAERLLKVETITHDDIVELLGPRPHQTEQYKEYLTKSKVMEQKYGTDDPAEQEKIAKKEMEDQTEANNLKEEGDGLFLEEKFDDALLKYSDAIAICPDDHIYYSKRAILYGNMDKIEDALVDAKKCIELNPEEGYLTRGTVYLKFVKIKLARKDFEKCLEIEPNNASAKEKLEACTILKDIESKSEEKIDDSSDKKSEK